MGLPRNLNPAVTPLRLTLAVALIAVASSGYVVVVAQSDTRSTLEIALARGPQQTPCRTSHPGQHGPVSFATASP